MPAKSPLLMKILAGADFISHLMASSARRQWNTQDISHPIDIPADGVVVIRHADLEEDDCLNLETELKGEASDCETDGRNNATPSNTQVRSSESISRPFRLLTYLFISPHLLLQLLRIIGSASSPLNGSTSRTRRLSLRLSLVTPVNLSGSVASVHLNVRNSLASLRST